MLTDPKALLSLFGQQSIEALRYIHPLGRYVFFAAMIYFFLDVAQNRGWIRNSQLLLRIRTHDRRPFAIVALVSILALCFLVLLISWTNGGTQDYSAIGGLLPYSDAAGYFGGAERLLHDGVLTSWAERRPLNSAFFAARLSITQGNFYYAMIIQAAVAATALFMALNAIFKLQGSSVAFVFFAINFSFLNGCLFRTLSEPLGISFGLISFALYLPSTASRNLTHYAFATFLLTLALLTRAGAMFELLASLLFAVLFFADKWRRRCVALAVTVAAIAGGWLLNVILVRTYGTGGTLLSNFSYVIYGLSQGGKNWSQVMMDFPNLSGNEAHVANFLYHKAFETIIGNPLLLVAGITRSLFQSLIHFPIHVIRLLADASDGGTPWKPIQMMAPAALLIPGTVYGAYRLVTEDRVTFSPLHLFLFLHVAAFIVSLPFFYHDGGIRLTAATFPFLAAAVAMVLAACRTATTSPKPTDVSQIQNYITITLGLSIIVASLTIPMANRVSASAPAVSAITCAEDSKQLRITLGDGTAHINILDGEVASVLPDIRRSDFSVSDVNEIKDFWQTISLPTTVVESFDYVSHSIRIVTGPVGFASGPRRITSICATPLGNGVFSYRSPPKNDN